MKPCRNRNSTVVAGFRRAAAWSAGARRSTRWSIPRPSRDYDHWASLGNSGWDYASVLPFFKRAENSECIGENEWRGVGRPLNVAYLRSPSPINDAFLAACKATGIASNPDYNDARQEGYGPCQVMEINGERCSAAKAYLSPNLGRPNLQVVTGRRPPHRACGSTRDQRGLSGRRGNPTCRRASRSHPGGGAYGSPSCSCFPG